MTKVVKNDVIKLNVNNIDNLTRDKSLSEPALKTLWQLDIIVGLKNMPHYMPVHTLMSCLGIKNINQISLYDLSEISSKADNVDKLDINVVISGIKELVEKGYLCRDTDGTLSFTPTGSMQ